MQVELLPAAPLGAPALEAAVAQAVLQEVAAGRRAPALRVHRPAPTVAFGRLDALRPGFGRAAAAARRHGFEPVLRAAGGHAAAYHEGCLIVDEAIRESDAIARLHDRFRDRADLFCDALSGLGVDARIGEVPGEYCPGEWSVNARGAVKLVGTAQRVIRDGWLFGTVIVVERSAPIREVLADVYRELDLAWDPATAGGVADELPSLGVADVEAAVLRAYGELYELVPGELPPSTLEWARRLEVRHRVDRAGT